MTNPRSSKDPQQLQAMIAAYPGNGHDLGLDGLPGLLHAPEYGEAMQGQPPHAAAFLDFGRAGADQDLADQAKVTQLASSGQSDQIHSQLLGPTASHHGGPSPVPVESDGRGYVVPGVAGPNLVKSMGEQQYVQNLQTDGQKQPMAPAPHRGKYANVSASTERTKTAGKSPQRAARLLNLPAAGAEPAEGQRAGNNAGPPGGSQMFPGSQMSVMQSQSPTGLAHSRQPEGQTDEERVQKAAQPPLGAVRLPQN